MAAKTTPTRHLPPDMTVPLMTPKAVERQRRELESRWECADEAGSADAAYARGLLRLQMSDVYGARGCLSRADARGSAEAAYLLGLLHLQASDPAAAEDDFRRADRRHSLWAPFALAALEQQARHAAAAREAWARAVQRARDADEAGSADGSCLLAVMATEQGDVQAALEPARRADTRGSREGAFFHAYAAQQIGDLAEALRAAERAAERGFPAQRLLLTLGDELRDRRRFCRARLAWRVAVADACEQGDTEAYHTAVDRLHPGARYWVRSHIPGVAAFIAVAAVLLGLGQWPWLATVTAWASVPVIVWGIPHPGMQIPVSESDPETQDFTKVSVAGLDVAFGRVGENQLSSQPPPPVPTRATRDRDYFFLLWAPVLAAGLALALTLWAAGLFGDSAMLRTFYGWWALVLSLHTGWRAPDVLRPTPPAKAAAPAEQGRRPDRGVGLVVGLPLLFGKFLVKLSVREPRIAEIQAMIGDSTLPDSSSVLRLQRTQSLLGLVTTGCFAVFLAVEALVPEVKPFAAVLWVSVSVLFAVATVGLTAVTAVIRVARGLRHRAWGSVFTGAVTLLVIVVAIAVAYVTGLLHVWTEVGQHLA